MGDTDPKEIKEWILENLVTKQGAMKITGQSGPAFQQAVRTNMVTPFVEYNESPMVRLYLKSEIEAYAEQVKFRKGILKK
jgi:predicted Zn-dependent peptidase